MQKKLRPPFKIHGGKRYLSEWIIDHFPEDYVNYDYVEPFVGAGSVFLNKLPAIGHIEVINDIDIGAIQIFQAIRDEPKEFIKRLKRIKYKEKNFNEALHKTDFKDYMEHAVNEFVVRRMSRGGLKKNFGWSDRERGGKPGDVNAWETIIKTLPFIHERIYKAKLFNRNAVDVITAFNDRTVLLYCDPPYVPDSRTSPKMYEHEMTIDDHIKLGQTLLKFSGKAVISGYSSSLYDKMFKEWRIVKKKVANHSSQQKHKSIRTEVLWMNY